MKRIDAHQHFWVYNPTRDAWITDDMPGLQRDFLPQDLLPVLTENKMEGCVAVQADQSVEETQFLMQLSNDHSFIKAVVGWVDLCAETVEEQLEHITDFKNL